MVFIIIGIGSDQSLQLCFIFGIDHTCLIGHNIFLFGFCHILHSVRSVMTTQFPIQPRPQLYNHSHRCPIQFQPQSIPGRIGQDSLVSFSAQTIPIQWVMSLFYLVFVVDYTRSDQSKYLSFFFSVNDTSTIGHVVTLSSFGNIPHLVQ